MASIRQSKICGNCLRALQGRKAGLATRPFSTTSPQKLQEQQQEEARGQPPAETIPRWQQTPAAMKMPYRLRPLPEQPAWNVNTQQEPLDLMYDRFFGNRARGRDMLPEEVKWLAVTHKSFDHGRRGFNERLAFMGRRIVELQASMALLNMPAAPPDVNAFQHPSLEGVENVTTKAKATTLSTSRLAGLAASYGIDKVVRWKPRQTEKMRTSGMQTVLAHTVYSIIGALALQKGGETAARVTRDRVLQPLGLRTPRSLGLSDAVE